MSKGGGEIQETPQQRAQTEFAVKQLQDYKQRWLPLQQNLAKTVTAMGGPDSTARKAAAGKSNVDTQINFSQAQGAVEKALTGSGAGIGSGRFDLGMSKVATDAATSRGLGAVAADQQVDDAYTQALGALAATGRGERAGVGDALSRQATESGRQAAADAQASVDEATAQGQLVGQFAGYGLSTLGKRPTPQGPGMGRVVLGAQADQFQTNPQAGP